MTHQQAIDVNFEFVPPGTTAESEPGRVYVDVGNAFAPGVLDHHAPGTPCACSAELVLRHPGYVLSQVGPAGRVTIVIHRYPDLDAISGVYFASQHLRGQQPDVAARAWGAYVCAVDRGDTRLDPARPINPYSVLMMGLNRVADEIEDEAEASLRMLEVGLDFVDTVLCSMRQGVGLDDPELVEQVPAFEEDVRAVLEDHARYLDDMARADQFLCELPRQKGEGTFMVPGLWIEYPRARLFKSWARGDTRDKARPNGFVFTGVQVSEDRAILSVAADSGVTLRGLGDCLETAETAKRARLGCPRTGPDREGFDSPDPWYDGRSKLHGYTIVDAPRAGTVLTPAEIRGAFEGFLTFVASRVETALEETEEALGEQRDMTVDEQLRDFSRRRVALSESEWHAFYLLVKRILAHECADLIARLIDPRDDLIHDFFMDKVFILTGEQNEIYHAGALKKYFLRYLLDELRPLRRRANESGLQDADGGELGLLELALNAVAVEQNADQFDPSDVRELAGLLVDSIALKVPGGEAIRDPDELLPLLARHLGVNAERLSSAASDFLEGRGEWAHLKQDAWWIRLYLRCHFCPGGNRGMALYRLAKRHHVPSYHNKAKSLGLSLPKGAGEALACFRNSHVGRWLLGCGVPVEAERLDEVALAVKILCLAALEIQEPC